GGTRRLALLAIEIAGGDRIAMLEQVLEHGEAHAADADDANPRLLGHTPTRLARATAVGLERIVARRVGDLVEPVEAHLLYDAIRHHDQSAVVVIAGDVRMVGERRNVDVVAALPGIRLGLRRPF